MEFKFVVKQGPHNVVRWEEGKNHILNSMDITAKINECIKGKGGAIPAQIELPIANPRDEDKITITNSKKTMQV